MIELQAHNDCHLTAACTAAAGNSGGLRSWYERGDRNSPTSVNAGFHYAQFWDGRADDLKAQAKGPILNPIEMGMPSEEAVIKKLSAMSEYPKLFAAAFSNQKEPLTYDNLAEAIAAFERTLISRDRFDEYLKGKTDALSLQEQKGLKTFIETGCLSCHSGVALGGSELKKLGMFDAYKPNGKDNEDHGRQKVTSAKADADLFNVPSLRNIALTAPYFHDGQVATLDEAGRIMAKIQLNKDLSDTETADIVAFLKALNGKLPNL